MGEQPRGTFTPVEAATVEARHPHRGSTTQERVCVRIGQLVRLRDASSITGEQDDALATTPASGCVRACADDNYRVRVTQILGLCDRRADLGERRERSIGRCVQHHLPEAERDRAGDVVVVVRIVVRHREVGRQRRRPAATQHGPGHERSYEQPGQELSSIQ